MKPTLMTGALDDITHDHPLGQTDSLVGENIAGRKKLTIKVVYCQQQITEPHLAHVFLVASASPMRRTSLLFLVAPSGRALLHQGFPYVR